MNYEMYYVKCRELFSILKSSLFYQPESCCFRVLCIKHTMKRDDPTEQNSINNFWSLVFGKIQVKCNEEEVIVLSYTRYICTANLSFNPKSSHVGHTSTRVYLKSRSYLILMYKQQSRTVKITTFFTNHIERSIKKKKKHCFCLSR